MTVVKGTYRPDIDGLKPKLNKNETLSIVIFPASGEKLESYSKQASGSIAIETIGVADI